MSIAECIAKLVATGQISKPIADEATALYERSKGEYSRQMGPAQAEAAAGLATAKAMQAGARAMKNDAAKQALAFANFEKVMLEHPDGKIAGVLDQLTASLRNRGTRNVDSVREDIWNKLASMFGDSMTKFSPGITGMSKQQIASARNLIREIYGESTGDALSAAAARAWEKIKTYGETRAKAAGRNFQTNEDWRVPQPWLSEQVRKVKVDEFKRDFQEQIDKGGITRLWDKTTERPAAVDRQDFVLERAYHDIITSGGTGSAFSRDMRTFEFAPGKAGADAWLALQQKYGVGDNIFGMLTGHMNRMATEISLAEVIGPNHQAIMAAVMPELKAAQAQLHGLARFNPARIYENKRLVQATYDVLTGRANVVDGPTTSAILGGIRSINTASQLKGAIVSSVPGDSATTLMAARYNGMPIGRLFSAVVRELSRGGEESRSLASRMELTSHGAMEYVHGYRFFQDQIAGPSQLRWLATTMIKAQGLEAWTELIKRTFSMEFMGHLADHAGYNLATLKGVNRPLADFLERYQISPAEWDKVRAAAPMDVSGVKFLDTTAIGDERLAEKIRTGVIQERRYAMLEPDARIRGITTGGLPQGTFVGELMRNIALFKSFSLTMGATHLMRIATQGPIENRIWNGTLFAIYGSFAGALAMQAKNIVYGKDPQSMASPTFWAQSFLQGTGLGIYGDLLNSAFSRSGNSITADIAGPAFGLFEDVRRLTSSQARRAYEGKDVTFGAEATKFLRRYTPGTFYTKLAVDRLIYDQLQQMVDPQYRSSFRRSEQRLKKDSGQEFWFRPGKTTPDRAPNLGAAIAPPP